MESTSRDSYQFIRTPANDLSCLCRVAGRDVALHSKFQPVAEAERFVRSQLSDGIESLDRLIIYGIGCGHHVRAALRLMNESIMVQVVELNADFFAAVSQYDDLHDLLASERVMLTVCDTPAQLKHAIADWNQLNIRFLIHEPSLKIIPVEMHAMREVLANYQLQVKNIHAQSSQLQANFERNMQLRVPGIEPFFGQFNDVPVVMVAAGPSLEHTIEKLHEIRKHCLIACVGRTLKLLLDQGIEPDFFVITDAGSVTRNQILHLKHQRVPMKFLSTVYPEVPLEYEGPKHIILQNGWSNDPVWLKEHGQQLVDTGGSVATTLFSVLCKFGFHTIVTVGLDLAFTSGKSHAKGAYWQQHMSPAQLQMSPEVINFDQSANIRSSHSLLSYRYWFMRKARQIRMAGQLHQLINASVGGAHIVGFEHLQWEQVTTRLQLFDATEARKRYHQLANSM